jgi:hypothetical protein
MPDTIKRTISSFSTYIIVSAPTETNPLAVIRFTIPHMSVNYSLADFCATLMENGLFVKVNGKDVFYPAGNILRVEIV